MGGGREAGTGKRDEGRWLFLAVWLWLAVAVSGCRAWGLLLGALSYVQGLEFFN